jgi:tetratricopeptide (TPR) repeat protein
MMPEMDGGRRASEDGPVRRVTATGMATVVMAMAIAACHRSGAAVASASDAGAANATDAADAADASTRGAPAFRTPRAIKTTDAAIYLGNLDGEIEELTRLVKGDPSRLDLLQRLSAAHYVRARYRGDLDEIQAAIGGLSVCVEHATTGALRASCLLGRAEQEQSLHRFKDARIDVDRAGTLGADPFRAANLRAELDWNDGLYDRAIPQIRSARRERPSTATWMREAQLDHDLGDEPGADAAFVAAENLIVDTAPLPVAHLDVQRGIASQQHGQLDQAALFFRAALEHMPNYIAANEHLAETLHQLGQDDESTVIYEKIVAQSSDPEFLHALAVLDRAHGKADQADGLDARARAGYEALLQKYPEAMYWHAAEFYLSSGDAKTAIALLQKNILLRPGSPGYVALARAELANGDATAAKEAIGKALAMPIKSAELTAVAAQIYGDAGVLSDK